MRRCETIPGQHAQYVPLTCTAFAMPTQFNQLLNFQNHRLLVLGPLEIGHLTVGIGLIGIKIDWTKIGRDLIAKLGFQPGIRHSCAPLHLKNSKLCSASFWMECECFWVNCIWTDSIEQKFQNGTLKLSQINICCPLNVVYDSINNTGFLLPTGQECRLLFVCFAARISGCVANSSSTTSPLFVLQFVHSVQSVINDEGFLKEFVHSLKMSLGVRDHCFEYLQELWVITNANVWPL